MAAATGVVEHSLHNDLGDHLRMNRAEVGILARLRKRVGELVTPRTAQYIAQYIARRAAPPEQMQTPNLRT